MKKKKKVTDKSNETDLSGFVSKRWVTGNILDKQQQVLLAAQSEHRFKKNHDFCFLIVK